MELKKLKTLKPSYKNLSIIGRVGYEATGNNYFLHLSENVGFSVANGINFFEAYYNCLNDVLEAVKNVDTFTYNLVRFNENGGTTKVPFLYNSL